MDIKGYYRLLEEKHPQSLKEIGRLAAEVLDPYSADALECWNVMMNKPLFANTKVDIAAANIRKLSEQNWDRLRDWSNQEVINIVHNGGNSAVATFEFQTVMSREIRDTTRIAPHRLFAIQNAARNLERRAQIDSIPLFDIDFAVSQDRNVFKTFKSEFGKYWGDITMLHLLTDLGMAVKPDLHLVRAINTLDGSAYGQVPRLSQCLEINRRARELSRELFGDDSPRNLRRTDKTLMEISMHLLGN